MTWPLARGHVVQADIGPDGPRHFVVVSNDRRNRHLDRVLAVRLTTTTCPRIPSIVPLDHPEAFTGSALCDDIVELDQGDVQAVVGALSIAAMRAVGAGLAAALDLP